VYRQTFGLTPISFCDILVARRLFGVASKQSLAFFDIRRRQEGYGGQEIGMRLG
jgi:hypothetical protein